MDSVSIKSVYKEALSIIGGFCILLVSWFSYQQYEQIRITSFTHSLQEITKEQALKITSSLYKNLETTYLLAQEVRNSQGDFPNFNDFAKDLLQKYTGVTNLQLAKDAVVSRIYPLRGSETAIGHDLLKDDNRKNQAIKAKESGLLTLAGPFHLKQGGYAIIGRNPVYLVKNGKQYFWGFTSTLVLVEQLLASTDLPNYKNQGYRYKFTKIGDNQVEDNINYINNKTAWIQATEPVMLLNGSWQLVLASPLPEGSTLSFIYWLNCVLASFLFTMTVYYLLDKPERIQKLVEKRTNELNRTNVNLINLQNSLEKKVLKRTTDLDRISTKYRVLFESSFSALIVLMQDQIID